jgi:MFS family permease
MHNAALDVTGSAGESRRTSRPLFALLALSVTAYTILQTCVTPILPMLSRHFNSGPGLTSWVATATLLSASVLAPILGSVGDAKGKNRVLAASLAAAAGGCVISAAAPTIEVLLAGRMLQGAGAGVVPLAFGIIRDEFPPHRVPTTVGRLSALLGAGSAIGYVIAGPIVGVLSYAWIFWLPAVVLAAAAVLSVFMVPPSPRNPAERIPLLTVGVFSLALVALLAAISQAPGRGWSSPVVICLSLLALVGGGAWVCLELKGTSSLIDVRMLQSSAQWATGGAALMLGFGLYATLTFLPQFLQAPSEIGYGFSMSVTDSGLMLLPLSIAFLAAGFSFGWAERLVSSARLLACGSLVSGISLILAGVVQSTPARLIGFATLFGFGVGLAFAALSDLVIRATPPHQTAVASAVNTNLRLIGGAVGVAATATVLASSDGNASGYPSASGFSAAFLLLGCVVLAGCAFAMLLELRRESIMKESLR